MASRKLQSNYKEDTVRIPQIQGIIENTKKASTSLKTNFKKFNGLPNM